MSIDDETAISELEALCDAVADADKRLTTAFELAPEDEVESTREAYTRADEAMRTRVPEIGAELFEQGGEVKMREILDRVSPRLRASISSLWDHVEGWTGR